jgi:lipoprotein-releasing system permease protein
VLDLPKHMTEGTLEGLRRADSKPPERKKAYSTHKAQTEQALDDNLLDLLEEAEKKVGTRSTAPPTPSQAHTTRPKATKRHVAEISGAIEPTAGFASQLPEDDVLEGIVSDPCHDGNSDELPGIVIGETLKNALAVELGGCVQVTSPTIGYSFSDGHLRPPVAKQFRVQGVFKAGFDQYDSKLMYTDLYEAQAFYGAGDTVTGVEMRIRNIDDSATVVSRVDTLLNNGIYHTMDWEELNHGLFTALRIQQILMSLVLALIILVAAFTVIATLIMIVFDKKREIAVLKAMGATDGSLLRAFLYQGLIIGIGGTLVGLGLGYLLCSWVLDVGIKLDPKVYFISKLPVVIQAENFVTTGVFAILVCLGACIWPALHAARLRPAEAFREQ